MGWTKYDRSLWNWAKKNLPILDGRYCSGFPDLLKVVYPCGSRKKNHLNKSFSHHNRTQIPTCTSQFDFRKRMHRNPSKYLQPPQSWETSSNGRKCSKYLFDERRYGIEWWNCRLRMWLVACLYIFAGRPCIHRGPHSSHVRHANMSNTVANRRAGQPKQTSEQDKRGEELLNHRKLGYKSLLQQDEEQQRGQLDEYRIWRSRCAQLWANSQSPSLLNKDSSAPSLPNHLLHHCVGDSWVIRWKYRQLKMRLRVLIFFSLSRSGCHEVSSLITINIHSPECVEPRAESPAAPKYTCLVQRKTKHTHLAWSLSPIHDKPRLVYAYQEVEPTLTIYWPSS